MTLGEVIPGEVSLGEVTPRVPQGEVIPGEVAPATIVAAHRGKPALASAVTLRRPSAHTKPPSRSNRTTRQIKPRSFGELNHHSPRLWGKQRAPMGPTALAMDQRSQARSVAGRGALVERMLAILERQHGERAAGDQQRLNEQQAMRDMMRFLDDEDALS